MKKYIPVLLLVVAFVPKLSLALSTIPFANVTNQPFAMIADPAGNLYVGVYSNTGTNNIKKITPGGLTSVYASALVLSPTDMAIDNIGNIFTVSGGGGNAVIKTNTSGVSTVFGVTGSTPYSVAVDSTGNIYTANYGSNSVSKIDTLGNSTILGTTGTNPRAITIDASGNIYTANYGSNNVSKIDTLGVSTILGTTGTNPIDIVVDAAGNVYTANYTSGNISKITPFGVSTILGTVTGSPISMVINSFGDIYTVNTGYSNPRALSKVTALGVSSVVASTNYGFWTTITSLGIGPNNEVYTGDGSYFIVSKYYPPAISQITPVSTPTTRPNPDYTFNTSGGGTITYGGSCSSVTTTAFTGNNTVTFNTLAPGTYNDCTLTVTDGFGTSNILAVSSFTIVQAPLPPDMTAGTDMGVSNTDNITNDTTPDFTGICTTGDTVSLKVDGIAILPTQVCVAGLYAITPGTAIAPGSHSITSTFTNLSGVPESAALLFTIDNGFPLLSVRINTTGAFTPDTPQIVFTASDAASGIDHYEVTYNTSNGAGGGVGPATTINPGSSPVSLILDPNEFPHEVTVTVYDVAGNSTTVTTRFVPVVTINAPTVISNTTINNTTFTVTTPTGNDITGLALTGTASTGATFSCIGFGGDITSPYASPVSCMVSNITASGALTISAQDSINLAAGNNTQSYVIDSVAPGLIYLNDVATGPVQSDTIILSSTDAYPNTGSYSYGFSSDAICDATDTYTNTFVSGVAFAINTEINNGKYICARSTDLALNTTYLVSASPLNIDITPPTVALSTGAIAPVIAPITVTIDPSELISELTLSDIVVSGGTSSGLTGPDGSGNYSITVTPNTSGMLTITMPAGAFPSGVPDMANNRQTVSSNALSFQAYIAPTGAFVAPDMTTDTDLGTSNTDNLTSDTTPTFTGICVNGDTVTLQVDGAPVLPSQVCALGVYSITPNVAITEGPHTIASVFSNPGGSSGPSPILSFTIDSTPPIAPGIPDMTPGTDSGTLSTDDYTSNTAPAFTITCLSGSVVSLYNGSALLGTGTCTGSIVTITSTILTEGVYNLTAKQIDSAGNISVSGGELVVTIDTTVIPPSFSITGTGGSTGTATGTCESGGIVSLSSINLIPDPTTAPCVSGTYTTPINTSLNPATILISQTDLAGNTSTTGTGTFTYTQPSGGGSGGGKFPTQNGQAISPTPTFATTGTCSPLLTKDIVLGNENDPVELNKLISFLNENEGATLPVDGTYDQNDFTAVKAFQAKYLTQIITPWGGRVPTGIVSTFTRGKINVMNCARTYGCPYFKQYVPRADTANSDVPRIKNFLTLLTSQPVINLDSSIRSFQSLYKDTVLKPWNLPSSTGNWYKTTRYAANEIAGCKEAVYPLLH